MLRRTDEFSPEHLNCGAVAKGCAEILRPSFSDGLRMTPFTSLTKLSFFAFCMPLPMKGRREFAGDEGVQGAEAGSELCGGPTALVVEPAEKLCRG
jgi:hypothetical protein